MLSLALAAGLALVSCGTGPRVVARVADQTITERDLLEAAAAAQQEPWSPDSAKHRVLDDLIRRKLMLVEARHRGLDRDTVFGTSRRAAEEDALTRELTSRVAPTLLPVSAPEIEEYYGWRSTERHVEVVLTFSEATARRALARLRAGEPFAKVASETSPPGTTPPGGDLGFVPGGAMLEPLDHALRHGRPNEFLGPLASGGTWFVARILEERTRTLPPIAPQVDELRSQLRQRKQRAIVQRAVDALRENYAIQVEPGAGATLFARMNPALSGVVDTTLDDRTVLARYFTGRDTVRYMLTTALGDMAASGSDATQDSDMLERWIETQIVRRVVVAEARRWHLDQEPEVVRRIEARRDNEVLRELYQAEILDQVQVTDDELRAEYEQRLRGPNHPPFEEMPAQVREQLRSIVLENHREAKLREFTDGLRRRYPVTIDEDALARVRWPVLPPALPSLLPSSG